MSTDTATPQRPWVIAYSRVSTDEQADSGLGLADQRRALDAEADRRGWADLDHVADEGYSAKDLRRPGIAAALDRLAAGDADVLAVAKLDRLSRSLLDFAALADRARHEGWQLVALDLGVDTSTPSGALMANVMASFAEYERHLIGARTSAALAQRRAAGARLGRPVAVADAVADRIAAERQAGASLARIADGLNTDEVPTAHGGARWHPSTVRSVLNRADADAA